MMCASTVQVAAQPGEVVSNTGKQNRKVLATPVMESFASITGVTTLRECGIFTEKELRKIAARIAADNGVEVMFFL